MRERSKVYLALAATLLPSALGFLGACGGDSKAGGEKDAVGSTASNGSDGSGGSSASGGSGGSSASGGSGGSSAGGSGAVTTNSSVSTITTGGTGGPNDLSGTWELIVSEPNGDVVTRTVTLSPTQLGIAGDLDVLALVSDEIIDIAFDGEAIRATREPSDMNLGVIPLPFGGLLRFTGVPDEGPGCVYSLDSDSFTLVCTDDISMPSNLPNLDNANLRAERTEALSSDFGELGGRWSVTTEDVDCSVVLQANTIAADCAEDGSDGTEVNITVGADRITGSTSEGLEFTAQRR